MTKPGSPARRERNPEETKRRILEAAEDEFARKGFGGVRLREVATAAGVHHALLHHYYGDKEGLFRAVVERAFSRLSSRALELLGSTTDIQRLLVDYVDTVVDFHAHSPNLFRLLYFASLDEGSTAYAACVEVSEKFLVPILEAVAATVEAAQARGAIRSDIDARRLVCLSIGAAGYIFHDAGLFSAYLGVDVRSEAAVKTHKEATLCLLRLAILPPP